MNLTSRLSGLALAAVLCICSLNSHAATFTVINTNDAGAGSLRQAITSANANPMDADNITFNIPTSDPNYNAATGVFTITLASLLPTVNSISVSIDGTTQPGNTNPDGPEICLRSTTSLMYGLGLPLSGGVVKGLIINGFMYGIALTKFQTYPSGGCTVSDCYIGVNHNGTVAVPNDIGIAVMEVSNNTFKDNLISGNTISGIGLRKANSNTVQGNRIGSDRTGTVAIPNYYGVAIDSCSSNIIGGSTIAQRNIISGNAFSGIAINSDQSHDNVVKGNYIGINATGAVRSDTVSNYYGIAINDSYNNTIGGSTAAERNIISGNREAGIAMLGAATRSNSIRANYIGTNVAGTDSIPNGNGILISGGSENAIGGAIAGQGNVISGNSMAGIALVYSGTRLNTIKGNMIGTNGAGNAALSNHTGIYIKSNANKNTIGGTTVAERNIISGNWEMGLTVEAADSNIIIGNYIGPDVTGMLAFTFSNDTLIQGNGLMFNSNAKRNTVGGYTAAERNVISGNRIYGHDIYGNSSYNLTIGNYIGVDATGNNPLPNATGICVDGGSNHNPIIGNVLSGNLAYGMFIVTTGSDHNEVKGNMIGTNAAGTDTIPNQIGVILGGGTRHNIIGGTDAADRNIISGNRFDGVEVADIYTSYNSIIGNYIGTDVTGSTALPNLHGIGLATNPSSNNIESNVISGNRSIGIILYEGCDSTTVYSNLIGTAADGNAPLPNDSAGIIILQHSKNNIIGMPGKGNTIAFNGSMGIVVMDANTVNNTISANLIHGNGVMGIDIFPFGVNANDAGDADMGPNEGMNYPVILTSDHDWMTGETTITGTMDCSSHSGPAGVRLEFFRTDGANMFDHGDAVQYLGSHIITDNAGNWTFIGTGIDPGDRVTATATDSVGNTSEFSLNSDITVGVQTMMEPNGYAIYPNPTAGRLNITFSTEAQDRVCIGLYSVTGQQVAQLTVRTFTAGSHTLNYDLTAYGIAPGTYFLRMAANGEAATTAKVIITR